jgi:hypothetical protein
MPGNNPAQRVLNCLSRVNSISDKENVSKAFNGIFGDPPEGMDPIRTNSKRMEAIQEQIDAAAVGLRKARFPDHLFVRHFDRVRHAFLAPMLGNNHNWAHVKQYVAPEVLVAFEWSAYALEDEGGETSDPEMQALIEAARGLRSHSVLDRLPPAIRKALENAIEQLISAAALSPITGAGPVAKAVKDLAIEVETEAEVLQDVVKAEPEGRGFAEKVKGVFTAASTALKKAYSSEHVEKIARVVRLIESGIKVVEEVTRRLPPPGGGAL